MKSVQKHIWLIGCLLFLAVLTAQATIDATLQMQLGDPSGATSDPNNHNHYLVQRTVEALDYSDVLGEPVWASWDLTAADIGNVPRGTSFFTDSNLPASFYHVTDNDYNGVGNIDFARGHMCPSEDRTDTTNDNNLVFLMSNIIPQASVNNSGVWGQFESYCRDQTASNELLIICGPSGFGTNRIPSGKAAIAAYTWKIAVVVPTNSGTALSRITSGTRVIALKIPNDSTPTLTWPHYVTSVNQIEVDTGFTFFTALPSDVATVLRNKVDGSAAPPPAISSFSPASGAVGTNVMITGTNFNAATAVTFGGASATFIVNSNSQITATVPTNASTGLISVTTTNGTAISTNSFTVINTNTTFTGTLAGWDVSGATAFGPSPYAATIMGPNVTNNMGLARGFGVTEAGSGAGQAWGGTGFTSTSEAAAITAGQYVTFAIKANANCQISFNSVSRFDYRRSMSGPANGVLQYQAGNGAFTDITNLNYSSMSDNGAAIGAIDLTGFPALQNVGAGTNVTFRIVNFNGSSGAGTWYIYDKAGSTAPDLSLAGTVIFSPPLPPLAAWRFQWFGTTNNGGGAADTFVATSDGMPNLLKYALGLNPAVAATNPVIFDITTGYPRLTTPRNTNATDVTISGSVSGDLMNWTTNGTVIDREDSVFQVHDSTPVAGGTNRFMRLQITDP